MVTVEEIKEKRKELEQMEKEYLENTPPCCCVKCSWHNYKNSGNCNWSVLLEDCNEYKPE